MFSTWFQFALVAIVWLLWIYGAAIECEIENFSRDAEHQRSGVSFFPVIPLFPLILWGLSRQWNELAPGWGTFALLTLHAMLGVWFLSSIVHSAWQLRTTNRS